MVENNGKIETQIPITDKDSQEIVVDIVMEGKSAYDLAVERGFDGTLEEWLLSLHGKDGKDADVDGIQAQFDTVEERLDSTDAQLNDIEQDFTQHELDYEEHKEDYNTLESEFTQHKEDYNTLESEFTQHKEDYNTLESEFTQHKEDYNTLESEFTQHKLDYEEQRVLDLQEIESKRQQDQLKVAKVEKDINYYQATLATVNINQEAKQKATGYGVVSLPKNSANGQSNVSVKGETRTSLFSRRDEFKFEFGSGNIPNSNISVTEGKTYTISAFIVNGSTNPARIRTAPYYATYTTNSISSGSSGWAMCTFVALTTEILTLNVQILEGGMANNNCVVTMLMVEETNNRKSFITTGTKSTISASRLKSVGKNLFDKNKIILQSRADTNTGNIETLAGYKRSPFIKVLSNKRYTRVVENNVNGHYISWYDSDKNYISRTSSTSSETPQGISSPINAVYAILNTHIDSNVDTIQLEQSDIASPYEPYTESTQYLPNVGELRSLPNGVKDEIRVSGGKAEHVQRIKKHVLQASAISSIRTDMSNIDYVTITLDSDISSLSIGNVVYIPTIPRGWVGTDTMDSIENIGKWGAWSTASRMIAFAFTKGTTLEQARQQLEGTTLTYQLAEPIITPIDISGTLLSNPSGTVYVENVVADAGIYNDGISVLHQDLPISEVEKLSKVDFTTGVETDLDVSECEVSEDSLSFTHPNLTDGDIVFFTYYYDLESTLGETTLEYYDSRYVLKDDVTGKFYKVVQKVSDGELVNELVEV